jgi:hypothetical protein
MELTSMATGFHGLPKVSPELAMPYPSTPCGRATPETFVRPAAVFYPFEYPTPYGPDLSAQKSTPKSLFFKGDISQSELLDGATRAFKKKLLDKAVTLMVLKAVDVGSEVYGGEFHDQGDNAEKEYD